MRSDLIDCSGSAYVNVSNKIDIKVVVTFFDQSEESDDSGSGDDNDE